MISQTSEYALRAMVFLAEHRDGLQAIPQIAEATKVPASYLSKVMQNLAKAGLVHSQRGMHGGFSLTRGNEDLTIYDIVQAVDPIQRITKCPLDLPAHAQELCALHCRLDQAAEMIENSFRETTLAALLRKPIFGAVAEKTP
ncbi:MAG: Rrf2 family transcriptional regulator [Capsulimonas sp.]|uniref:RrF2 family transcriptional regulator n=1 Tax=Capsulimonas sp. TaxID=2494211 RepID=UPI00326436AA